MNPVMIPEWTVAFLIVFARIGTLVMLMPAIGERYIPARLRLGFALSFAFVLLPLIQPRIPPLSATVDPSNILGLLFGEVLIGLIMGLSIRLLMSTLNTAGTIIAQSLGLSFAMTIDPTAGMQNAAIGNLLTLLGLTLVFALDLHHLTLAAMYNSYTLLPMGGVPNQADTLALGLHAVALSFQLALKIAAPFVFFGILFNVGLGILSRMMPQMQIFFVGMPIAILAGMLIFMATLALIMSVFTDSLRAFLMQFIG
jgi:flagellar biosynthesis protein FliR